MKTPKLKNSIKALNIDRQLITQTTEPIKENVELCAAEAVLVCHGVKHGHSYLSQQYMMNACKTIFFFSPVAEKFIR